LDRRLGQISERDFSLRWGGAVLRVIAETEVARLMAQQ
jgi:hypothetical protein